MIQANALYGSNDVNQPEALGTAVELFMEDVEGCDVEVHQMVTVGEPSAFTVEVTFFIEEGDRPQLDNAEDYEILG